MPRVALDREDLGKLLKYALAHCECKCPEERDPETCIILAELAKLYGLRIPCLDDFGGFSEKTFTEVIKDIEMRRGKKIEEFMLEIKTSGTKCLQDQIDKMDAEFAMDVLKTYGKRRGRKTIRVIDEKEKQ